MEKNRKIDLPDFAEFSGQHKLYQKVRNDRVDRKRLLSLSIPFITIGDGVTWSLWNIVMREYGSDHAQTWQ